MKVSEAFKQAMLNVSPEEALAVFDAYIAVYMEDYDKAKLYKMGRLRERASIRKPINSMTENDIIRYVGGPNYDRGLEYISHLTDFTIGEDIVSAIAHGNDTYEVWAGLERGFVVESSCTCPVHSNICKHVSALLCRYLRNLPKVESQDNLISLLAEEL